MEKNSTGKRAILIVLDGIGVGALPDAGDYGDENANTLKHLCEKIDSISVPNLENLGLGNVGEFKGIKKSGRPIGGFGKMAEQSAGKESVMGHWEITGIISTEPFPMYPKGFSDDIIEEVEKIIGRKTIGNVQMSGIEVIRKMEREHIETGHPIVYCAQDSSCFQLAAHQEIIPISHLYQMCEDVKKVLFEKRLVARVIAKPFKGRPGSPVKSNLFRKDYTYSPPYETTLDRIISIGLEVVGIGRIAELYNNRGISRSIKTKDNIETLNVAVEHVKGMSSGLAYVTLKDFDSIYGHSRDYEGLRDSLEFFDKKLGYILNMLDTDDLLIITADHGLDSTIGTDHTREYVPLLAYGRSLRSGVDLGTRNSFADVGQTVLEAFNAPLLKNGKTFFGELSNYRSQ